MSKIIAFIAGLLIGVWLGPWNASLLLFGYWLVRGLGYWWRDGRRR